MTTTDDSIHELRLFIHQLMDDFASIDSDAMQSAQEWLAANKMALMHRLSDLTFHTLPSKDTGEQFKRCLIAMARLSNRIHRADRLGKLTHPQQRELLALTASGIHELIGFAEFECKDYFPTDMAIPDALLASRRLLYKQRGDAIIQSMHGLALSTELLDVLIRYFAEFCQRAKMTFAQEAYFHKLCDSIPNWLERQGNDSTEHTLHRLLCYYNFNRMDYLDLLTRHHQHLATSTEPYESRMASLHYALGTRRDLLHSSHWAYEPAREPSVYEHAIQQLENKIELLSREREFSPIVDDDYLHFLLEQGEWCVLLDILVDKKHFGHKATRRRIAYFLAAKFRTMDNRPLNPDTLRRSGYPHREKDVRSLYAFFEECQRWLHANYPNLF